MGLEIKTTANRESTWSITSKITDKLRHHKRTVTILRKQWKKFETRSTFHIFSIVFKSSCWTQITYEYSFFFSSICFWPVLFSIPFPPYPIDGPVPPDDVGVLRRSQSNLSCGCFSWMPPQKSFSKLQTRPWEKKKLLTYLFILKKSIIQFLIKCFGLFSKLQVNQSKKRCI